MPWDGVPGYSDGGLCTRPGSCDLGALQIKVVSEPESHLDILSKVKYKSNCNPVNKFILYLFISATMSQEEMWPRDFPLSPTAIFGCVLYGDIDHTSADCPNILQVCKYCGGPLLVLTKMCSCCGLIHSEVLEYQVY